MRLSAEDTTAVIREVPDGIANKIERQLNIELSEASYSRLTDSVNDALTDALVRLDFEPEVK